MKTIAIQFIIDRASTPGTTSEVLLVPLANADPTALWKVAPQSMIALVADLAAAKQDPFDPAGVGVLVMSLADFEKWRAAANGQDHSAVIDNLHGQLAQLSKSSQDRVDEVRAFYEKELAELKSQLADKDTQLAEAHAELGRVRDALAGAGGKDEGGGMKDEAAGAAGAAPATSPPDQDVQTSLPPVQAAAGDPVDLAAAGLPTEVAPPPHSAPVVQPTEPAPAPATQPAA